MTEPIKHKVSEVHIAASLQALFADLQSYNAEFSIAGSLSRVLQDATAPQTGAERQSNRERQQEKFEAICSEHRGVLALTGLGLRLDGGPFDSVTARTGRDSGRSSLSLTVAHREALLGFLRSLDAHSEEWGAMTPVLSELPRMIASQIRGLRDLDSPSDQSIDVLASVNPLVAEYRRLGLDADCAPLVSYAEQIQNRSISEYLQVERAGLLNCSIRGYAPGDLQRDADPYRTRDRWEAALSLLESLGQRPQAYELQQRTALVLDGILEAARAEARQLTVPRQAALREEFFRVELRLLPFTIEARQVAPEDVEGLSGSLADLQRAAAPHLFVLGNVLAKEMGKPENCSIALHQRRSGELLGVGFAGPRLGDHEAEATLMVLPEKTAHGLELRLVSEIEDALYSQGFQALRVSVPTAHAQALLDQYGDRAEHLASLRATDEVIVRIRLQTP